ncbi:MAG: carboxypeptidase regulatory-like domain-containing protein, partial [bacterium]|nr:carboxypeptidase regulatory-like domain-containing protein [bacterium]
MREIFTDAIGAYEIAGLPAATYTVRVVEPGFSEGSSGAQADLFRHQSAQLHHQVTRQPVVTGVVFEANGDRAAGAMVIPVSDVRFMIGGIPRKYFPESVFTDCTGQFEIAVSSKRSGPSPRIMAVKKGLVPALGPRLEPGMASDRITLTLDNGPSLRGVVTTPRGAPLAGVKIAAFGPGYGENGMVPAMSFDSAAGSFYESSADGSFKVPAGESQWDLILWKSGHGVAVMNDCSATESADPLMVILKPLQSVQGRVVRADGSAVAGAMVELNTDRRRVSTSTTEVGEFMLPDLKPGTAILTVVDEASGARISLATMIPGRAVAVTLPTTYTLAGRVIDRISGEPLAGAKIMADALGRPLRRPRGPIPRGEAERTDVDGRFTIKGLDPGRFEVHAKADGYLHDNWQEVEVGGETPHDITISLEPGLRISGTIRDSEGEPIAGAKVLIDLLDKADPRWDALA